MPFTATQADWKKTALRLPQDIHRQLHETARNTGRTFNSQILTFVREGLQAEARRAQLAASADAAGARPIG